MNKNISIKTRLFLLSVVIQAITLLIFSYSLHKILEVSIFDKIHSTLRIITLDVVDNISKQNKNIKLTQLDNESEYDVKPLYIRIIDAQTSNVIQATAFPKQINIDKKKIKNLKKDVVSFYTIPGYVVSQIKINSKQSKNIIVQVATSSHSVNSTLKNLFHILIIITPIIFIISILGAMYLLNRAFQPVETILQNLNNIQANDLSQRLPLISKNDEIGKLTHEINSLLQRLEISFDKISQFSSDASHELKTPLTIIRGEIEIGLRKDRTKDEYKAILQSSMDEILIIQQTIDDLLFLAKSEQTAKPLGKEEIYLDEISLEAIKELESFGKLKSVDIEYHIKDAIQIQGYSKLLKIAIKNILKNSIVFSHKNSIVTLKNYIHNDYYNISVEDHGIGITKKDQKMIFEKFYRTDKSRSKDSGGTGLGMAIAEKIIKMHDGNIVIHSKENIGTTILFQFPRNI